MRGTESYKLITCIIPAGRGLELVGALRRIGINSARVHHARGAGRSSKRRRGASLYAEREVLRALVPAQRADEVFVFLYQEAQLGNPHTGILLMEKVVHGIPLVLPDVPDE